MKYHESEGYLAWIRSKFPGEEEKVMDLWRKLEELRGLVEEIEQELVKYTPKDNNE